MITCPRCQVPNPPTAQTCVACGAGLAGQKLSEALTQAQPAENPIQAPQSAPQPQPAAAPQVYVQPTAPSPGIGSAFVPTTSLDAGAAQADIDQFVAQQRARKRRKRTTWFVFFAIVAGGVGFQLFRSAQRKARREQVARFLLSFQKVDDGTVADFWRCVVRAKHADVRLAKNNLIVRDGLDRAFTSHPRSQPGRLRDKCLPMLDHAAAGFKKLSLPDGFDKPVAGIAEIMAQIKTTFAAYLTKLDARVEQTANEQELLKANQAFHSGEESQADLARGYVSVLHCAVPDLPKMLSKIRKPPDTQPIVEYIYHTCKEKPDYAERLRTECIAQLKSSTATRSGSLLAVATKKMSGDDRDRMAIQRCLDQANRGFFDGELNEVGKIWVEYRNRRNAVLNEVAKYKEGGGEHGEQKKGSGHG